MVLRGQTNLTHLVKRAELKSRALNFSSRDHQKERSPIRITLCSSQRSCLALINCSCKGDMQWPVRYVDFVDYLRYNARQFYNIFQVKSDDCICRNE